METKDLLGSFCKIDLSRSCSFSGVSGRRVIAAPIYRSAIRPKRGSSGNRLNTWEIEAPVFWDHLESPVADGQVFAQGGVEGAVGGEEEIVEAVGF